MSPNEDDFGEMREVRVYTREAMAHDLDKLESMAMRTGLAELNWTRQDGPDFALVLTERSSDGQRQTFLTLDVAYAQMLIQALRDTQTRGDEMDIPAHPSKSPFLGYRVGWPEDWVWNNGE